MSVSHQDVALAVINFLQSAKGKVAPDFEESLDVAVDCIADAFEVDKSTQKAIVDSKFGGKDLVELLQSVSISTPAPVPVAAAPSSSAVPVHIDADEANLKAEGEKFKTQGNVLMRDRDFQGAVEKYTEALNLFPTNAVYLSNRAAAYSSLHDHESAVKDAEAAIKSEPSYAKAYSRLGLAKYLLGDAKASMEAYEQGLKVEGDKQSDAMKKGYETAKKKVMDELKASSSITPTDSASRGASTPGASTPGAGAGGLPDLGNLASMFGGAGAGAGGAGGLAGLMNNPQIMQAAQQMMQNPDALRNLMSNPQVRQMAESFGLGGAGGEGEGGLGDIMNNPMFQNFMGGNNNSQ
ncbi:unnamed protein product [Kuraishia capsulata CBS 1993]|uniref:STI1 domain-containing protein n=1 Tax=Kuraishia capsulata CBS 1993 TaxID=1382522 RepID=W6MH76_9ASCO|nr:uncharacterized protein KUCA_T00001529001 [Kuraishia capsulata CBS 1993]CDK25559.1 unnamed protein product [Kuraishia capsulata CBS 1993]